MFQPIQITTRHFMREYKRVIEQVKTTKEPAVVVSQKQPQVAIVSLDDLDQLTQLHARSGGQALLRTARQVRELLKDERLPADLATHHDHYLWDAPLEDAADTTDAADAADASEDDPGKANQHELQHDL